ncbi:hypothetical protein, partial [Treponema sp. R6D11]
NSSKSAGFNKGFMGQFSPVKETNPSRGARKGVPVFALKSKAEWKLNAPFFGAFRLPNELVKIF